MPSQAPHLPNYTAPGPMPSFQPASFPALNQQATAADTQAYGASDTDFQKRYPQLWQSQQTMLNNLQTQMGGNVPPQMQNLWARSGLGNALQSTGGWSLGTGTSGMANIARNLGVNQMGYQQQLLQQFGQANDTFRPRTFGLSGADAAQVALQNIAGQNNWNQAKYAYDVQGAQYQTGLEAQAAVGSANAQNATTSNIIGGISTVATVAVAFCWVARAVLGQEDLRWMAFREYLLTRAPRSLAEDYLRHGQRLAAYVFGHPSTSHAVRALILEILEYGDSALLTKVLSDLLLDCAA